MFCALNDQSASLGRHAQLTRCFSAVAELLVTVSKYSSLHNDTHISPYYDIYTVSGKKRPEYFSHNFEKFRHSFVIFGANHPDTSVY